MLKDYFNKFTEATELTLVGPMKAKPKKLQEPIIFVDGGSQHQQAEEGLIVGDGDSSNKPVDIELETDKDESDLAYVLKHIPKSFQKISAIGFSGGRPDHWLMVLSEFSHFLEGQNQVAVDIDSQLTLYSAGSWEMQIHGLFSLYSFTPNEIQLSGQCQFPHEGPWPQGSSLGLSNNGQGSIQLTNQAPIVLFR